MKKKNSPLYVPSPPSRPGIEPDFTNINFTRSEEFFSPDINFKETFSLATNLIQIENDTKLSGAWSHENKDTDILEKKYNDTDALRTLKLIILNREYDKKLMLAQRQSKLSFYMQSKGEELCAIVPGIILDKNDFVFPSYRQQGLLFARGHDMVKMMSHCLSNKNDNLKGKQLPVHYSWPEGRVFSVSGNLGTQFPQAVGAAMAESIKGGNNIAVSYIGDGATAEGDFHAACVFASVYRAPAILFIVNNQWAISTTQNIAGGENTSFASRAYGYGLPGLRVDGNDFFAVYNATSWAYQRAKMGLGTTIIEFVTYRAAAHSTSDDPTKYRNLEEGKNFPLGDPEERLKNYLISKKLWSDEQHNNEMEEAKKLVNENFKKACEFGLLEDGHEKPVDIMFSNLFHNDPWHIKEEYDQAKHAYDLIKDRLK